MIGSLCFLADMKDVFPTAFLNFALFVFDLKHLTIEHVILGWEVRKFWLHLNNKILLLKILVQIAVSVKLGKVWILFLNNVFFVEILKELRYRHEWKWTDFTINEFWKQFSNDVLFIDCSEFPLVSLFTQENLIDHKLCREYRFLSYMLQLC